MNLNNRSILNKKVILNKLPLTAKVLAEVVETREEYAIRRVWWAASRYRQENIYPTQSQISHRASLNSETAPLPRVKSALDAALQSLAPLYTVESAEISPVDENQITINTEG